MQRGLTHRVSRCLCLLTALLAWGAGVPAAPADDLPAFGNADTLETLSATIGQNGYSFKVGHTWVYDLSPAEREAMRGRRRSPLPSSAVDDIGPLAERLGTALPERFDWRDRDGRSYLGPVRNQGACGSCYAFGAAAAAEGVYNIALGLHDGACENFSEAFIAWCLGLLPEYAPHFYGCEGADYEYAELEALTREGIPRESALPYTGEDPQTCAVSAQNAPRAVFTSWHRVGCGEIETIKTAIRQFGPVDAAVKTTRAFDAYTEGVYADANTACPDCANTETDHAVSLVGWDDDPPEGGGGCWILRNSWGEEWGENGYMRIRYRAAAVSCAISYLVYKGGPMPVSSRPVSLSCAADVATGAPFTVDVAVWPIGLGVDAWGVVYGPRGSLYSFSSGNPSALLFGAEPFGVSLPGIQARLSLRLLELRVPPGARGEYRIVAGLVPVGVVPTGPGSAVPGYVDQKAVTVH